MRFSALLTTFREHVGQTNTVYMVGLRFLAWGRRKVKLDLMASFLGVAGEGARDNVI